MEVDQVLCVVWAPCVREEWPLVVELIRARYHCRQNEMNGIARPRACQGHVVTLRDRKDSEDRPILHGLCLI